MAVEPRVRREAPTLRSLGYNVLALGLKQHEDQQREEVVDMLPIYRLDLPDVWLALRLKRFKRWINIRRSKGGSVPVSSTMVSSAALGSQFHPDSAGIDRRADIRNLVYWLTCLVGFTRHFLRMRPDVIHVHDLPPALPAVFVARFFSTPIVYESHECWLEKFPTRPWSGWVARQLERLVCRRAVLTIVVNDSIADRMVVELDVARPISVWNTPDVTPMETPRPPGKRLRLLYHGAIDPGRGVDRAVRAVAMMTADVELVIRGSGAESDAVKQLILELNQSGRIFVEQPVQISDVVGAAANFQIGIIPLHASLGYEYALPNKLFEFMASGLAIVSTDLPEIRKVVVGTDAGLLVDPAEDNYPRALASALSLLVEDRERLSAMRQNAINASRSDYTWANHQRVLSEAYRSVLGTGS